MAEKHHKAILVPMSNRFDLLSEEIVFVILDFLDEDPLDKKAFSLACKSFRSIESRHRRSLKPLRSQYIAKALNRYRFVSSLDLSSCPRIEDPSLAVISSSCCKETLRSINLSRSRFFSHVGLSSLVLNCVNLIELDLSNATEVGDVAASVISKAKNLEKLWLVSCKSITDIGIGCVAVGCKKLRILSLRWCLGVGDLGVGLIAVKCKEIRSLDLSHLPISDKCLPQILELPRLEELSLEGCFGIEDNNNLSALRQGCKSLEKLDMSSCQSLSGEGLSSLISSAERLRQLILSHSSRVDIALADSLRKLTNLQSLKLDGCQVTSNGLKSIGRNLSISLKELSLRKCLGVADEGLSSLIARHRDLRKLDVTCCSKITQVSMAQITSSCASLVCLKMESCSSMGPEAFAFIGNRCEFLEEIDLTDSEVDDEGLKSISRCSRLTSLKLGICMNITDEGLVYIGECCSKLKELDLYRSPEITDMCISSIARGCPGLETINTAYCNHITDHSLLSLSKCGKLSTLECRGCPFITSSGLTSIAYGCRKLSKLDVKKCKNVDDSGMIPLAQFSHNLKQINLSYTSVTDVGLLSLASISCLQSVTILHLGGLTPCGLALALVACGGLTKVKLQSSFRSLLPRVFFEHLVARGCSFQWRDKVFQVELDPRRWKLQSAETQ